MMFCYKLNMCLEPTQVIMYIRKLIMLFMKVVSIIALQEAADVYKRLLLEHRDFSALNIYLGLCYNKLDFFDVSSEILEGYLQHNPDSAAAINLKACNLFKLYTGKAAEAEIKVQRAIARSSHAILLALPIVFPRTVL